MARSLARSAAACVLLGALGGCVNTGKHRVGGNEGSPIPLPDSSLGALTVNADGEVVFVDAKGKRVPGCLLPGEGKARANDCVGLKDTTVLEIQSLSVVKHRGSTCTTIGPIFHGGRAYYYQFPPGCGH